MKQQILQADPYCSTSSWVGKTTYMAPSKWLLFSVFPPLVYWFNHPVCQPIEQKETESRHFFGYPIKLWDVIFKNSLSLLVNNWNLNSALFGFKFLFINSILNTEIHGLSDNSILQ